MKLRTRLAVSFLTVTVVPMLLIYMAFVGISGYQTEIIRKNYGLSEQIDLFSGNSMQMFNRLTQQLQRDIRRQMESTPDLFEDQAFLSSLNEELLEKYAYLIVRKGADLIFIDPNAVEKGDNIFKQAGVGLLRQCAVGFGSIGAGGND